MITDGSARVLIDSHQALVMSRAKAHYREDGLRLGQLFEAGQDGLWQALVTYDNDKAAFSTHAFRYIDSEMRKRWSVYNNSGVSLDDCRDDDGPALRDVIADRSTPPDDLAILRVLHDHLDSELRRLPAAEAAVLQRRFGWTGTRPQKVKETAAQLGITTERVLLLECAGLDRLRERVPHLADYLEERR